MEHPVFIKLGNAYINLYDICGIEERTQKKITPMEIIDTGEIYVSVYLRSGEIVLIDNVTLKEFEELVCKYQYGISRKPLNESKGD